MIRLVKKAYSTTSSYLIYCMKQRLRPTLRYSTGISPNPCKIAMTAGGIAKRLLPTLQDLPMLSFNGSETNVEIGSR